MGKSLPTWSTQRLIFRMCYWMAAILVWELMCIPVASHSNSWQGIWVSLGLLPLSAYRMARRGGRSSTFFVYGFAGSLLFLPRFFGMDRFGLWIQYQSPSTTVIILLWIGASLALGALCWGAAELQAAAGQRRRGKPAMSNESNADAVPTQPVVNETAIKVPIHESADPRLGIAHLMLLTACIAGYLGVLRVSPIFRLWSSNQDRSSYAGMMMLSGMGAGATLFGLLLFVIRRIRGITFPKYPGEFLLLALGVHSLFSFASHMLSALIDRPDTTFPSHDMSLSLGITGAFMTALVLLIPAVRSTTPGRWRVFFFSMIASSFVSYFQFAIAIIGMMRLIHVLLLTPNVILLGVMLLDLWRRTRYAWTHWLGVGIKLWFSSLYLVWLVWDTLSRI